MAVSAARDLLGVSSALLDHCDEVWEETKRVVKHAETRRVVSDLADLRIGLNTGSLENYTKTLLAPNAPIAASLQSALRDCNDAAGSFKQLGEAREAVVSARVDALNAKDAEIMSSRETLKAEIASLKSMVDAEFVAALRPLASVYTNDPSKNVTTLS